MTISEYTANKPVGEALLVLWTDKSGISHKVDRVIAIKPIKGAGYALRLGNGGYAICRDNTELTLVEVQ